MIRRAADAFKGRTCLLRHAIHSQRDRRNKPVEHYKRRAPAYAGAHEDRDLARCQTGRT